jgi:hypothetical protein
MRTFYSNCYFSKYYEEITKRRHFIIKASEFYWLMRFSMNHLKGLFCFMITNYQVKSLIVIVLRE